MKRIAIGILVIAMAVGAVSFIFRKQIALRLMERVVTANIESPLIDELPDGLHVLLCGAGSPLADAERSGPCVAVIAGEKLFIFDSGSGSSRVLARARIPQGRVEALFLTHFHSDHIDGIGELMLQRWAGGGRPTPLPIYGGPGVEQVVDGFNLAYTPDVGYRVAHHGEQTMPRSGAGAVARPFVVPPSGIPQQVYSDGDTKIVAFRVEHPPVEPAVGYRIDYKGRSVVISGDTNKSSTVEKFAEGVDLLVHEALSRELVAVLNRGAETAGNQRLVKITADILDYHASPIEAAEIARDAKVGALLYYHIVPPLPLAPLEDIFLEGVSDVYDGPVFIGIDGTLVQMPADGDRTEFDEVL